MMHLLLTVLEISRKIGNSFFPNCKLLEAVSRPGFYSRPAFISSNHLNTRLIIKAHPVSIQGNTVFVVDSNSVLRFFGVLVGEKGVVIICLISWNIKGFGRFFSCRRLKDRSIQVGYSYYRHDGDYSKKKIGLIKFVCFNIEEN